MRSGTRSPVTCSTREPSCAPFRNSSGTRRWAARRSTRRSTRGACAAPTNGPIRGLEGEHVTGNRMLFRSTTVLGCVRGGVAALGADGQVTMGDVVVKSKARKVRRLGEGQVLAGFAGAAGGGPPPPPPPRGPGEKEPGPPAPGRP